jgi:hypothetical protein
MTPPACDWVLIHEETKKLLKALASSKAAEGGELLELRLELTAALGMDVKGEGRGTVKQALKIG